MSGNRSGGGNSGYVSGISGELGDGKRVFEDVEGKGGKRLKIGGNVGGSMLDVIVDVPKEDVLGGGVVDDVTYAGLEERAVTLDMIVCHETKMPVDMFKG